VGGAPSGRSRKQQNELDDPDAAPLEQNIKNLECDGVVYRVVKEIIDPQVHPINPVAISPSRKDQNRRMARALAHGKGQRKSKQQDDDSCHAVNAGANSAIEEVLAEDRHQRQLHQDEEFQAKIRNAVRRRNTLHKALEKKANVVDANEVKMIVNDAIYHFYKPPKKFTRDDSDEESMPAPVFSADKSKSVTMFS